jgi:hypothetical protein
VSWTTWDFAPLVLVGAAMALLLCSMRRGTAICSPHTCFSTSRSATSYQRSRWSRSGDRSSSSFRPAQCCGAWRPVRASGADRFRASPACQPRAVGGRDRGLARPGRVRLRARPPDRTRSRASLVHRSRLARMDSDRRPGPPQDARPGATARLRERDAAVHARARWAAVLYRPALLDLRSSGNESSRSHPPPTSDSRDW